MHFEQLSFVDLEDEEVVLESPFCNAAADLAKMMPATQTATRKTSSIGGVVGVFGGEGAESLEEEELFDLEV